LKKVRAVIQSALPEGASEVISYRIPCVKYKGMLVGAAVFANHCSLFGMSSTLLGPLKEDLKNYSTSKGTIRFAVDKLQPANVIKKLRRSGAHDRIDGSPRWLFDQVQLRALSCQHFQHKLFFSHKRILKLADNLFSSGRAPSSESLS